jgi:hypothetical protein
MIFEYETTGGNVTNVDTITLAISGIDTIGKFNIDVTENHVLRTIRPYERVMVLQNGSTVEFEHDAKFYCIETKQMYTRDEVPTAYAQNGNWKALMSQDKKTVILQRGGSSNNNIAQPFAGFWTPHDVTLTTFFFANPWDESGLQVFDDIRSWVALGLLDYLIIDFGATLAAEFVLVCKDPNDGSWEEKATYTLAAGTQKFALRVADLIMSLSDDAKDGGNGIFFEKDSVKSGIDDFSIATIRLSSTAEGLTPIDAD